MCIVEHAARTRFLWIQHMRQTMALASGEVRRNSRAVSGVQELVSERFHFSFSGDGGCFATALWVFFTQRKTSLLGL